MLRMMETVEIREPKVTAAGINPLASCFTAASFLGAFLLFQLEPMMAKMLLPSLGGSAAVRNTAMVFFQVALVLGYALAHLSLRGMRPAQHIALQLGLLLAVLLTLPIALPLAWRPPVDANPVWWTLLACLVMGGAPFVVLSTTGPTMQRWFSYTDHPRADDPYFLYAAGNVGSLLALLTYPLVVEPNLALSVQSLVWTALFVIFLVLTTLCALAMLRHRRVLPDGEVMPPAVVGASPRMSARRQVWWVVLAAIPAALLLGVTRHLATDIASVPLLWVIPLALYLGTFILAFGRHSARMMRGISTGRSILCDPPCAHVHRYRPSLRIQLPIQLGAIRGGGLTRALPDSPRTDHRLAN